MARLEIDIDDGLLARFERIHGERTADAVADLVREELRRRSMAAAEEIIAGQKDAPRASDEEIRRLRHEGRP